MMINPTKQQKLLNEKFEKEVLPWIILKSKKQ